MADCSWHERMRDFAFGQKPSAKYVKKKKMSFRSSCLFNTINHKGYIQFTVIGALQLAIHVEQTVVQESRSRTETRQTKGNLILNGNFLCLSCPSATFALQLGGFVPRDQLAPKGLLQTNHIGLETIE